MNREKVDGEHDDNGDEHFGHLPPCLELVVQVTVGRSRGRGGRTVHADLASADRKVAAGGAAKGRAPKKNVYS